jgi:hypothetical protein
MALTREEILAVIDRKPIEIDVPEWGGTVFVRPLSSPERARWEAIVAGSANKTVDNAREVLAVLSLSDAEGNRLFTEEDVPQIAGKNAIALERIGLASMKLSKLRPIDIAELAKN